MQLIYQNSTPWIGVLQDNATWTVNPVIAYQVAKANGAFAAGTGTINNAGNGLVWIQLAGTEADTLGPISLYYNDAFTGRQTAVVGQVIAAFDPDVPLPGGDPWVTLLPGAYGAGEAGNILGNLVAGSANALLDQANGVETGVTVRQAFRAYLAVLAGLLQTSGPISIFRNPGGTKNRVTMTLGAGGQRTSVTFDFS